MSVWWRRLTREDRAASAYLAVLFDIPTGCGAFTVELSSDRRGGAVVDLGCEGPQGFRGWSGGARSRFSITDDDATPGYLPGVASGTWQVVLGLHRVPVAGVDVTVTIELVAGVEPNVGVAVPVVERLPRPDLPEVDGMRWLAGDFHCHTVHSDGACTIDEVAGLAASAGLDFLAVTDHNTVSHHRFLAAATERSGVQLIPGQEVTTWRGHANAFGDIGWVDFRRPADDWIEAVTTDGGLLSLNHPLREDFAWRHPLTRRPQLVETWHSTWRDRTEGAPIAYLMAGFPDATPIGGSDFHGRGTDPPPGTPVTWVLTDGDDVLGGLRAGRTSISASLDGPLLLRLGDEFLVLDGDGLLVTTPDGRRIPVHGSRTLLPAEPGLAWLEDDRTAIQAISS